MITSYLGIILSLPYLRIMINDLSIFNHENAEDIFKEAFAKLTAKQRSRLGLFLGLGGEPKSIKEIAKDEATLDVNVKASITLAKKNISKHIYRRIRAMKSEQTDQSLCRDGLDPAIGRILKRQNINTIEELCLHDEKSIMRIYGIGDHSLNQIREFLANRGLSLKA
jgi:ERCC4-type nuclease